MGKGSCPPLTVFLFCCTFKSLVLEFPNWFQIHYLSIHLTREDGFKRKTLAQHPENCILLDLDSGQDDDFGELSRTKHDWKIRCAPNDPGNLKKTPQNRQEMCGKVRVYNNRCNYLLRLICLFF